MITPVETSSALRLSDQLLSLRLRSEKGPLRLAEVMKFLHGNVHALLVILLTLPFLTPIPLPGLSTPFGLVIGIVALRLIFGKGPWLPKRLGNKVIPQGFFGRLFNFSARFIRLLETLLRPRWIWLLGTVLLVRLHLCLIFMASLILLLPLPIPFSNTFPAWTILLVAGGILERDGLAVGLGYLVFVLGLVYFVFLGKALDHGLGLFVTWLGR